METLILGCCKKEDHGGRRDPRLVGRGSSNIAPTGFGQDVSQGDGLPPGCLFEQGDAARQQNGRILYRRDLLLSTLKAREVARIGAELAVTKSMPLRVTGIV